jgi:hypothetical protein
MNSFDFEAAMRRQKAELQVAQQKRDMQWEALKQYWKNPSTGGGLPLKLPSEAGLALKLPAATAEASPPLVEKEAQGNSPLDVAQRGAMIGEPIPIVFCRRTGGAGGVLISPPATEARFEDDASSNITASYHLVLSEGQIDLIQVRDVFQRACRVGSFTQTYDRRAGTFVAGNFIDNTPNLEAPTYCGTSGTYDGLSTMAFSVTIPAGFDQWDRQVHCFIRGGIRITRLLDSVTGPSNNVADLLLYLLRNSSRVPESMIDTTNLLAAATFTNANGFWFNGVVSESTNLRDWISSNLQYFLLRQARIGGKEALKPLVPTNNDGTIKTTAVSWVFTFTEQHIIPGSFEITYSSLADRKRFCATVLWRQQDDLGIPVMRTAEVRYTGTAVDGPYEQHDLSGFCSTENHAVKVGAYILSKRKHVTHRLQIGVKPDGYNPTLAAGDLVRVRLDRIASTGADSVHDYLYEVDRIGKSITGEVQLDLTHFPVDANLASVVAQEVNAATGTGLLLPTGLSGITCDVNSSADTSVPAETFTDATFPDYGSEITDLGGGFDGGGGDATGDNPADGLSGQGTASSSGFPLTSNGDINAPAVGSTLDMCSPGPICAGGEITYYRIDPTVPGGRVVVREPQIENGGSACTYTLVIGDIDKSVYAEIRCPDPTSPTGYGEPIASAPVGPVTIPAGGASYNFYDYANFTVQITHARSGPLTTTSCTSPFASSTETLSGGATVTVSGKSFFIVTKNVDLGLPDANPAGWLSANGYPGTGAACGASGFYNRNAMLVANVGTESAPSYVTLGLWGGNITMLSGSSYSGSHSTSIVSIKLAQNVAGLGVIGDEISGLGTYSTLSYPPN